MGSQFMDFPSPRGVHVPEAFYESNDPDDPYRRPSSHRNRYSRPVNQTPRIRNVTWISTPDQVTPQTPHAPPSPWIPPPQVPSSPAPRLPSAIPPSPAPTVGERMAVDDYALVQEFFVEPYPRPQRSGVIKSLWKGLKKISGFQPSVPFPTPRPNSYESQGVPAPVLSVPSEATQYVDPTPPDTSGTEDQRSATPYASPYVRPANISATPAVLPSALRASPSPAPSIKVPLPIRVVSPSIPSSPRPTSIRSARPATPGPVRRSLSVSFPEPVTSTEEGSQTLHEPVPAPAFPALSLPSLSAAIPVTRSDDDDANANANAKTPPPSSVQASPIDRSSSKGSLASTIARFRRFVADVDGLPWISDAQIADEYIPEQNPRSRMRARVRQGAEPSWYNPRPEVVERPAYWAEWDMWAKQSTAALWEGAVGGDPRVGWAGVGAGGGLGQGPGQWGPVYPNGYAPVQPGFVYGSGYPPPGFADEQGHAPVLP